MMILSVQRACSETLAIFQRSRAVKAEPTVVWCGFPGKAGSSMHHSRIPRRAAVATFPFCIYSLNN
ncbi:hypothetical protein LOK49_LG08G01280 [Camellia lanceoleosa]|uniref:Uncharacterized protein n=1 Tax=Camellia lanceoleosa TaxID=1840588 RepID=A0ACC0GNZ5_9ERIC|nr:hypothetical protein LOK49_LG08G01280 [Camellia lanceoleosa]